MRERMAYVLAGGFGFRGRDLIGDESIDYIGLKLKEIIEREALEPDVLFLNEIGVGEALHMRVLHIAEGADIGCGTPARIMHAAEREIQR